MACTRELNRKIPVLRRSYSASVLTVSLVLQLEAALHAGIGEGQISRKEATALIKRLEQAIRR